MRLNEQETERARAEARVVLPTPGTSSIRIWPRQSSAVSISPMASSFPTITFRMFCCRL